MKDIERRIIGEEVVNAERENTPPELVRMIEDLRAAGLAAYKAELKRTLDDTPEDIRDQVTIGYMGTSFTLGDDDAKAADSETLSVFVVPESMREYVTDFLEKLPQMMMMKARMERLVEDLQQHSSQRQMLDLMKKGGVN